MISWLRRPLVQDGAIAAALALLAELQLPGGTGLPVRLLLVGAAATVTARRTHPLAATVLAGAFLGTVGLSAEPPSVFGEYLVVLLLAYTVAERCGWRGSVAGGLALVAGVICHDLSSAEFGGAAGIASDLTIPTVLWGVGRAVRHQNSRARRLLRRMEEEREQLAGLAVDLERARLARELHDVVTHSVAVVVIQAQGAQRALDGDQPEVRQALAAIESAGRGALTEMRRLLGLLRDEPVRTPPMDVENLVRQVRAAGLPVELTQTGAQPAALDPAVALTVYRVVQEALTNTLTHAPAGRVAVHVDWGSQEVRVQVQDAGRHGLPRVDLGPGGRGLAGLRDRVTACGGRFAAAPTDGGFRVEAALPLAGR